MHKHRFDIAVKLASALLMKKGELAVEDIKYIPGVRGRDEAYSVARRVAQMLGPYYYVKIVDDYWRDGPRLRVELIEGILPAMIRKRKSM